METIENRIRNVMSIVFETTEESITYDSSADTIEAWDSIHHLNLIIALEEEFGISIPDDEVGNLVNFKLIKLIVNDLIK